MSKFPMCFSLLQLSRYAHANLWWERFPNFSRRSARLTVQVFSSGHSELDRRQYRRKSRQTVNTEIEVSKTGSLSSKSVIQNDILDETETDKAGTIKSWVSGVESTQVFRVQQFIAEKKDLAKHITFIVFDLETTGFSRRMDRIIEIALQDLGGGNNSTFQTLVNPECYIPNSNVHHITTHMVNRPEIPRMVDLIPILLGWIESRRKPDGIVILIAHNGRTFDVPFLIHEFSRCSFKIPAYCNFLDTMPLAREVVKSRGLTGGTKLSLEALCKLYGIQVPSPAHRALVDVKMLSLIYQKMTFELELSIPRVLEEVSRQSEPGSSRKKKS